MWIEWIEPWMWSMVQTVLIDANALAAYQFYAMGLTWLWNALKGEVGAMAAEHLSAAVLEEIHDEHDVIVAPVEDFGMDTEMDDTDFAPESGGVCTGPECLTDGPDSDL